MKKKFLIISASISLLLACFPFTLCAEEDPQSDLGISSPPAYYQLDNYFYDNYYSLPYIESDGSQYINTGISPNGYLDFNITFGGVSVEAGNPILFGSNSSGNAYQASIVSSSGRFNLSIMTGTITNQVFMNEMYSVYNVKLSDGTLYYDNSVQSTDIDYSSISNNNNIYIFNGNPLQSSRYSKYKLYSFSLYDRNSEEYVRYYYPAQAKSGGTIGLYDAVSKTFVTTGGSTPFEHPSGSEPIDFSIGVFITAGLGWISDILDFAIAEPLIICFMAIGLAGAMFRWGRKLVHF